MWTMPKLDRKTLAAQWVAGVLRERGWKQSDLARELDVSRQLVSRWRLGKTGITSDTMERYSQRVGVDVELRVTLTK